MLWKKDLTCAVLIGRNGRKVTNVTSVYIFFNEVTGQNIFQKELFDRRHGTFFREGLLFRKELPRRHHLNGTSTVASTAKYLGVNITHGDDEGRMGSVAPA